MAVLARFDGLFADLDMRAVKPVDLWTDLNSHEFWMASHPMRAVGQCRVSRESDWQDIASQRRRANRGRACLSLVFVGAVRQAREAARAAANQIYEETLANGSKHSWMRNTDIAVEHTFTIAAPMKFCPWAHWLATVPGTTKKITRHGVSIPSLAMVRQKSFAVNTWARQWSAKMKTCILQIVM